MKSNLWVNLATVILIFGISCQRESSNTILQQKGKSQTDVLQLYQQIDSLGSMGEFNPEFAKEYIEKTGEFVEKYPEDPMSADFLYKAGLMAMTVAKASEDLEETDLYSQKALTIFDDIQKIYPEFGGIKTCILNKGVVYDDILHDYENAEVHYRAFIARYPTDTLAINLESYLQYLGKTPEEIIALFEK
jgi:tetratricopeptide (TPR) repeat protein